MPSAFRALPALLFSLLALLWAAVPAHAQLGPRRVQLELVADARGVAPGESVWVALRQRIEPGWHTYWRNPGDSGQATQVRWTLPPGWRAGDLAWPAPVRERVGPLMNFGYTGEVLLPVRLTAPADALPGRAVTLVADVALLVCSDVCIPEDGRVRIDLPVLAAPAAAAPGPVARTLAALPRPAAGAAAFEAQGSRWRLGVVAEAVRGTNLRDAFFFPNVGGVIDHAAPQTIERGPRGLTLTLTPAASATTPPARLAGVLTVGGRAFEISAAPGPLPAGSAGLGPVAQATEGGSGGAGLGLPLALALALLGGLVLNLMPCVFPILALKASQLARHAHEPAQARVRGLAYAAGVLASFAGLAALVIALRSGGKAVGWGFQLQSPAVVAGLAIVMVLIALNLLGVFRVGAALQSAAGGVRLREGVLSAFGTGVLAVVVAAPCTAPFMAGAIGWGLTQDAGSALAVFLALGLGLALPYLLLSLFPALLARLPKPGRWMIWLQRALAVPLLATAAWLVWLLGRQAGAAGVQVGAIALAAAAGAAIVWGWSQRGGGPRRMLAGAAAALAAFAIGSALVSVEQIARQAPPAPLRSAGLPSQPWSPERLAALRAQGRPVLVNFTADWCVTCQFNERAALSGDGVGRALRRTNAAYLVGDWTRRDAAIAAELAAHGRAGVPLYLVYPAGGGAPRTLPQILAEDEVVDALQAAR